MEKWIWLGEHKATDIAGVLMEWSDGSQCRGTHVKTRNKVLINFPLLTAATVLARLTTTLKRPGLDDREARSSLITLGCPMISHSGYNAGLFHSSNKGLLNNKYVSGIVLDLRLQHTIAQDRLSRWQWQLSICTVPHKHSILQSSLLWLLLVPPFYSQVNWSSER